MVPLTDIKSKISNIQYISLQGDKQFLAGSVTKELFFATSDFSKENKFFITEGVATAISLYEHTSITTIAAMNTSNLLHVGKVLRNHLSDSAEITFYADNDRFTENNPGVTKAKEAADAINAKMITPEFPCKNCSCTDFNDLVLCRNGVSHEQ